MKRRQGEAKIEWLKKVYALYDEAIEHEAAVCRQKCSSCCTCNVTMTSLETGLLMAAPQAKDKLKSLMEQHFPQKRYIPKMTTNMFARMCIQDLDMPEEENDPSWGRCPLLVDDMCSVYQARPFGCRALMSRINCGQNGYAQVPPIVLTLNNLFMQTIEHVDENGFFGNLSDMLALFLSDTAFEKLSDFSRITDDNRFCLNEKITALMVPPEHRETVRPVLDKLSYLTQKERGDSHGREA